MSAYIPAASIAVSKIGLDWVGNAQAVHNSWTSAFSARIAVVALAAFTVTDASLHLALATTKLPFAAIKLGVDCFTAKPVMDALGFKEIGRHLYKVIQCIRILVLEMGWLFIRPDGAANLYALRGVYQKPSESIKELFWRQLSRQAVMFNRSFRYLADRPYIFGALALIIGCGLLHRYGLFFLNPGKQSVASTIPTPPIKEADGAAVGSSPQTPEGASTMPTPPIKEADGADVGSSQQTPDGASTMPTPQTEKADGDAVDSSPQTLSRAIFDAVSEETRAEVMALLSLSLTAIRDRPPRIIAGLFVTTIVGFFAKRSLYRKAVRLVRISPPTGAAQNTDVQTGGSSPTTTVQKTGGQAGASSPTGAAQSIGGQAVATSPTTTVQKTSVEWGPTVVLKDPSSSEGKGKKEKFKSAAKAVMQKSKWASLYRSIQTIQKSKDKSPEKLESVVRNLLESYPEMLSTDEIEALKRLMERACSMCQPSKAHVPDAPPTDDMETVPDAPPMDDVEAVPDAPSIVGVLYSPEGDKGGASIKQIIAPVELGMAKSKLKGPPQQTPKKVAESELTDALQASLAKYRLLVNGTEDDSEGGQEEWDG